MYKQLFTYMKQNNIHHFWNENKELLIDKLEMNEEQINELRTNIINSGINIFEDYNFIFIF